MSLDLLLLVVLIAVLMSGYPVALVLGGVPILFALLGHLSGSFDLFLLYALPSRLFGVMTNSVLLSIPLFVFMGLVLERSRLAEDMLDASAQLFAGLRGGLPVSVVVVGAVMAASTGIVGASVVTLGLLDAQLELLERLVSLPDVHQGLAECHVCKPVAGIDLDGLARERRGLPVPALALADQLRSDEIELPVGRVVGEHLVAQGFVAFLATADPLQRGVDRARLLVRRIHLQRAIEQLACLGVVAVADVDGRLQVERTDEERVRLEGARQFLQRSLLLLAIDVECAAASTSVS